QASERPKKITVNLLQNDKVISEHEVKAENDWKLTIDKLAAFDEEGKPYTYSISELDVAGYASDVNGFELTNTRSDTKDIEITKTWLDVDAEADRPTEIKVDLFRFVQDGNKEKVDTYKVKAENDWK